MVFFRFFGGFWVVLELFLRAFGALLIFWVCFDVLVGIFLRLGDFFELPEAIFWGFRSHFWGFQSHFRGFRSHFWGFLGPFFESSWANF